MADWPANGETEWNTKMLANLAIGHDTDGTHRKTQMLVDMEWSPTSYAGEESMTFPNGRIFKSGSAAGTTGFTVSLAVAFPTQIQSISVIAQHSSGVKVAITNITTSGFDVVHDAGISRTFRWQVWGF